MTKDWAKHRETILALYKGQSRTLDDVRRIMKETYGFEASVRAYRSRFDKWGINKYNIARRASATATMAASYEPAVRARGDLGQVNSFQEPGVQSQTPWGRHYSAPNLPAIGDGAPLYPQHVVHSQIKTEPPHMDDTTSPVSPIFRHGPMAAERSYVRLTVQHEEDEEDDGEENVGDEGDEEDERMGIAITQEQQTMLAGGHDQFPCHGGGQTTHTTPSGYTELEWALLTLQVPFRPDQLDALLHCLHNSNSNGRTGPGSDIDRPLATGHTPFGHLANLFFQHLSSSPPPRGGGCGCGDGRLVTLCRCLEYLLCQGAHPDVLVGGRPLLFALLNAPLATGAFGPLWTFVQRLASRALPFDQQGCGRGDGPASNALHVLLEQAPGGPGDAACPTPASRMSNHQHQHQHQQHGAAAETEHRVQLTRTLIRRLAGLGMLDDPGAQGLTAFGLYVRDFAARDGQYFFWVSAEFVRNGAGVQGVVPRGFVVGGHQSHHHLPAVFSTRGCLGDNDSDNGGGVSIDINDDNNNNNAAAPALWAIIWILACQRSAAGDGPAAEGLLSMLQYCSEGRVSAEGCRTWLPEPSRSQSVLASPATSGSEGSEEPNYTW